MTLDLTATYPGQIITTDPAYPLGKARDSVDENDPTGTPVTAAVLNDLYGFHQAALEAAGIAASGNPDSAAASDVLSSILALTAFGGTGWVPTFSGTKTGINTVAFTSAISVQVTSKVYICIATITYTNTATGAKVLDIEVPSGSSAHGPVTGFFLERNGSTVTMGSITANGTSAQANWSNSDSSGSRTAQVIFAYVVT